MTKIEINSQEELFNKVYKVLNIKTKELENNNIIISEKSLWSYLSYEYFVKMKDLTLFDVVDKILKVDNDSIKKYLNKDKNL